MVGTVRTRVAKVRAWGNLRGATLFTPPLFKGFGDTRVHSRVERKQLESVGYLALGYVRKGRGGASP